MNARFAAVRVPVVHQAVHDVLSETMGLRKHFEPDSRDGLDGVNRAK